MASLSDDQSADQPVQCTATEADYEGVTVISVCGTVDALTAPIVQEAAAVALTKPELSAMIIDLSNVDFLASAGMTVLVVAAEDMAFRGPFAVVADGPATSRPITLVGLTEMFPLFPSLEQALSELR